MQNWKSEDAFGQTVGDQRECFQNQDSSLARKFSKQLKKTKNVKNKTQ